MKYQAARETLQDKLENHLRKRIGSTQFSLDIAMRTILASTLGIQNDQELQIILNTQEKDGSWPTDSLYGEGKKVILYGLNYGNKSLPTAFSIKAIESANS